MSMLSRGRLVGVPKPADPYVIEENGEKIAFQRIALAIVPGPVYERLIFDLTSNVTANVTANLLARLKDRCSFDTGKKTCGISRAAHHVNDHDFTEPPAEESNAKV